MVPHINKKSCLTLFASLLLLTLQPLHLSAQNGQLAIAASPSLESNASLSPQPDTKENKRSISRLTPQDLESFDSKTGRWTIKLKPHEQIALGPDFYSNGVTMEIETDDFGKVIIVDNKYIVGLTPNSTAKIRLIRDNVETTIAGVREIEVKVAQGDELSPTTDRCTMLDDKKANTPKQLSAAEHSEIEICLRRFVVPLPRMLSFREVRDNFGRRIANEYAVVQVVVRNSSNSEQFVLQDITVAFDPKVCSRLGENFAVKNGHASHDALVASPQNMEIPPSRPGNNSSVEKSTDKSNQSGKRKETDDNAPETIFINNTADLADYLASNCYKYYAEYLKYPIPFKSADRRTVMGVGSVGKHVSPRTMLMSAIQFTASVGTSLTGIGLVGSDGKTAFGILGGSFLDSAKAALPDISGAQMTNLTEAAYAGNNIIENRRSEPFFVFIPRDKIFDRNTWDLYKKDREERSSAGLELRRIMELTLTSHVSGMFVRPTTDNGTISVPGNTFLNSLTSKQ